MAMDLPSGAIWGSVRRTIRPMLSVPMRAPKACWLSSRFYCGAETHDRPAIGSPRHQARTRPVASETRSRKPRCDSYCRRRFVSTEPSVRRGGSAKIGQARRCRCPRFHRAHLVPICGGKVVDVADHRGGFIRNRHCREITEEFRGGGAVGGG